MRTVTRVAIGALAALSLAATAGCAKDPTPAGGGTAAAKAPAKQTLDQALHDKLPASIRKSGVITSVNTGSFPPYTIAGSSSAEATGAATDLLTAVGQILGVKTRQVTVDGLSGELTGISAGRYDFAFGPVGDFKERQTSADFVDWVQEFVVFAVPKGNPKHVNGLADTCGARIAVQAGGSAEEVIKTQSKACVKDGKPAVTVQSYKDQPTSILAVRSGRADAFFSSEAPLTYFVQQSKGQLELAGTKEKNGFDDLYQGAVVPKNSPLAGVLQAALQKLIDNGTYATIMEKYGLDRNKLDKPGVNLAKS
ncbi:ABC transporter substrate-binding protein [Actinocatenispora rupis]|uniref:ABC transporter substrate-binding protein n=1 Tax=Actinocatenispora rupis TaxID=519421 RepID=A0A8J3J6J6_9ACTN|nr:ABC transporter substrate-binding protein [Actinocatenispora rupis]GID12541.1 ABC transporter substrate-binding protein [Actinocatenispora rupis]